MGSSVEVDGDVLPLVVETVVGVAVSVGETTVLPVVVKEVAVSVEVSEDFVAVDSFVVFVDFSVVDLSVLVDEVTVSELVFEGFVIVESLIVLVGSSVVDFPVVADEVTVSDLVFEGFVVVESLVVLVDFSVVDLAVVSVGLSVAVPVVEPPVVVFVVGSSVFVSVADVCEDLVGVDSVLVVVEDFSLVIEVAWVEDKDFFVEELSFSVVEEEEELGLVVLVAVLVVVLIVLVVVLIGMVTVGRMSVISKVDFVVCVVEDDDWPAVDVGVCLSVDEIVALDFVSLFEEVEDFEDEGSVVLEVEREAVEEENVVDECFVVEGNKSSVVVVFVTV